QPRLRSGRRHRCSTAPTHRPHTPAALHVGARQDRPAPELPTPETRPPRRRTSSRHRRYGAPVTLSMGSPALPIWPVYWSFNVSDAEVQTSDPISHKTLIAR